MRFVIPAAAVALSMAASLAPIPVLAGEAPAPPQYIMESPENEAVVVRLPDDSLRIFYVLRPSGDAIWSIESTDNGKTWSEGREEFTITGPGPAYYGVHVIVDNDGEFQCLFHVRVPGEKGYRGIHYNIWHTRTSNSRSEWSEQRMVLEGYIGSFRCFSQLGSGRMLASIYIAAEGRGTAPPEGETDLGICDTMVIYSDDNGETWQAGEQHLQIVQDRRRGRTRAGAVEPHIVPLNDGRLWMLIRTKNGYLYESFSQDDGTTWTDPAPSPFISSDSPAWSVRLHDGRLVLFFNACQRWDDPLSYAIGGRDVLHAAISTDDGKTWQGFREVWQDTLGFIRSDRGTAYPSATEAADGMIVLATGQGEDRRGLLLIDPDWLLESAQSDDFSGGGVGWSFIESRGTEIVDHPTQEGHSVLHVRRTHRDVTGTAVQNFPLAPSGEVHLRLMPMPGWEGATLALTDHYSAAADTLAEDNAVYTITIPPSGALEAGEWSDLTIRWRDGGAAAMTVNGEPVMETAPLRDAHFGISYLRLRSTSDGVDLHGFLVEAVSSDAMDVRTASASPAN